MAERESTEADDVFEFLESLPKNGDSKATKVSEGKGKNDDDIMDFLDELEKSNLSLNKKGDNKNVEKGSQEEKAQELEKAPNAKATKEKATQEKATQEKAPEAQAPRQKASEETAVQGDEKDEADEPLKDPITSISNWWSSSGSATVSSIWNKTTEQASQIKTKLASEQLDLTSKINAQTITELARNLQKIVAGETDEVLRIHLVHDLVNFPSLQYNVEQKFDQVLSSQVQGGIRIFVDQWGHPNKAEKDDESAGQRRLNLFNGKITDGEKLAFANLDNAIKLFEKAHEEVLKQQKDAQDQKESVGGEANISDIFISILPIGIPQDSKLAKDDIVTTDTRQPGNFSFTVILKDITNDISTITRSQGFPTKWVGWLEKATEQTDSEEEVVDPSDWVKEWVEDGLSLSLGVAAQNYVIERMGF